MAHQLTIVTADERVRFRIDGVDLLDLERPVLRADGSPRDEPMVFDPVYVRYALPPESAALLPDAGQPRCLVGVCTCGEPGCASLHLTVRREGAEVIWAPDPHPPAHSITHTWRFPLLSYLDTIATAVTVLDRHRTPAQRLASQLRCQRNDPLDPLWLPDPFDVEAVWGTAPDTVEFDLRSDGGDLERHRVPATAADTTAAVMHRLGDQLADRIAAHQQHRRRARRGPIRTVELPGPAQPLVHRLATELAEALGGSLVGLYPFGSLVLGDFDPARSDLDLLAVLGTPLLPGRYDRLEQRHERFAGRFPAWADRVEILYAGASMLRGEPAPTGEVIRISPGEPLHRTPFLPHWLTDLYTAQEHDRPILGPPLSTVLPPIGRERYVATVRELLNSWTDWLPESDRESFLGYAVLAICRALYVAAHGRPVSKPAAAGWLSTAHPQWADLVAEGQRWRTTDSGRDNVAAAARVGEFLRFAQQRWPTEPTSVG